MEFEVRDARSKNRYFIDNDFYDIWLPALGQYALAVYNALCRHANRDQKTWPSQSSIAEKLDISRRQVIRMLSVLENHNIIRRERIGKRVTNRYWLLDKSFWKKPGVMCIPVTSQNRSDVHTSHITEERKSTPATTQKNTLQKGTSHDNIVIPPPTENCGQIVDNSKVMCLGEHGDVSPQSLPVVTKHIEQVNTNPSCKDTPMPRINRGMTKLSVKPSEKKGSYRQRFPGGDGGEN